MELILNEEQELLRGSAAAFARAAGGIAAARATRGVLQGAALPRDPLGPTSRHPPGRISMIRVAPSLTVRSPAFS